MNRNITIDRYLERLAARSPVPGGGSAAALIGAVGISLLSMVVRYTLKRSINKASHKKLTALLRFTEQARQCLRILMSKDERAYFRLSKEIKKKTAKDMTRLYKNAAGIPLEVSSILETGLKRCVWLCSHCKKALMSDLAEAVLLLEAAFYSAKINVKINRAGIKDLIYAKKVNSILLNREKAVIKVKKKITKIIDSNIKGLI